MVDRKAVLSALLLVALATGSLAFGAPGLAQAPAELVVAIPIVGTIDEGLAAFVERSVSEAVEEGATGILIEINTFGGRVDSATAIRDALLSAGIPVIAFVRERAWSAGALIALAGDTLAMAPGASIGAAEPRPADEKTISALRAEFEATAERHGRDPLVAAAMVDQRVEIEGIVDSGELLTLSAAKAVEIGFADFLGASRAEVLDRAGFGDAQVQEAAPNWAERVARFLTDPTVSSILLTAGMLGLIAEITSPGWGFPGTAGLAALTLFFGARLITGLAGLEVVLLFVLGLGLLLLEFLFVPGFGLAGAGGLAAVFASLYLSFPDAATALTAISASIVATIVLGILLIRRMPGTGLWRRISLETRLDDPGLPEGGPEGAAIEPGTLGRALTPLRPAGTVDIGGRRVDAVSEGGFIPKGAAVQVVRASGGRVTVREYEE
ncbi:MAG: ATP-dependent Clp protease proteolytic subunit [Firmicutes bacterium]|nr:ATP-dependent Clp protease proteolytic subunit [Bacillota bacterium]